MKKNWAFITLLITVFYWSCKQKNNDVFPAIDFIKGQIAHVDTSMYPIIKLASVTDSTFDTTNIKREDFKTLAKDFLEIPDISKEFNGKYIEERMLNNDLGLVVFIATPKDENLEVRRQEVRIEPNPPNDKIKSIYIEKFKNYNDSSIIKRMTWDTDRKFQIVTITQKKNGEEKTSIMNVIWNDNENY
ncbi:MAG TPA: hypothetical protein VGQ09_12425 [Chitinophagaceae bacterium]|jgi:hypothetical protein|nr:hypothetical protein [Chitinophagaceae bacterium]